VTFRIGKFLSECLFFKQFLRSLSPMPNTFDFCLPTNAITVPDGPDAHDFAALPDPRLVRSSSVEAADEPGAGPRLYGALRRAPRENATRILLQTERLLRICGHRKITVADVASRS
jgi:hypothetical protein